MRMTGRAVLVIALIASIPGPASLASARATSPALPQGAELTDTELAQIEGSSTWIRQIQQTCAATPYSAAACAGIAFAGGAILVAFNEEARTLLREEAIRPWWEPLIARPVRECGFFGYRCW
jgi:hypothetical protein